MAYESRKPAILLLEDGTVFYGRSTGLDGTAWGEICFNTGMTGYQEIFTDPSYFGQLMVTATAHIGNYGTFEEEVESDGIKIAGLICKNFSTHQSRPSADHTLYDYFKENNKVAICDVDTRALVRHIRDAGAMNAIISTEITNIEDLKAELAKVPSMEGLELSSKVSTTEKYTVGADDAPHKVAALDLGIKKNILRNLVARGCQVTVYPWNTPAQTLLDSKPDGLFLSNGPGDPAAMSGVIAEVKKLIDSDIPVFGICLGHQMVALASDLSTYKMHNGHRGINHPIKNLVTGKGEITSQNHGFAVKMEDVEKANNVELTHVHLNDGTVAGIVRTDKPVFSVQYHPEAGPGPHDARYLFDQFVENMNAAVKA
ncbi:glutamine-hydrolyzing carbamoyl-phosphate synthase small subunit [Phaeocystidibacter luteus]|uniref:Carbamoyl phosphate synthase small chain n=1 Tax=Phaeocystidibacter luteus TaxID=911197 RepID=A0A6N6RED3_9FLAO|nr:glutamine-hydrolyzing carbamoyl-phosphate synthase small subunit [Phaeocystidibacter luteus]KAB2808107.1 glutamine-hydrolyzing carbamoyl-phosphate synthase small subunit [Phaeocystidibacter luteus]